MGASKGQPWDDWWDNLASQGHWTLPASRASRVRDPQAGPSEQVGAIRLTTASQVPERVSVPWREIEELHTIVSELDGEKRRLTEQADLTHRVMAENSQLRASVEFLEEENVSLRLRLVTLERADRNQR